MKKISFPVFFHVLLFSLLTGLARPAGAEQYEFTADWFSDHASAWDKMFVQQKLKGAENLRYLEVGVFEGRSFFWMLDNILTHPSARAVAVDIFADSYEAVFLSNLKKSGAGERVEMVKGESRLTLRSMPMQSFDIIYIDGSHAAKDVFRDAALCWDLLKNGGVLIFDDYRWFQPGLVPPDLTPKISIDLFMLAFGAEIELLEKKDQVVVKKKAAPEFLPGPADVLVGPYKINVYDFYRQNRIFDTVAQSEITLSDINSRQMRRLLAKLPSSYRPMDLRDQKTYDAVTAKILKIIRRGQK